MHSLASEENFNDGQIIFEEGSYGNWVYVILSGGVEIFRVIKGQKVTIARLKPGEMFGELGFLGGIKRTASAAAILFRRWIRGCRGLRLAITILGM